MAKIIIVALVLFLYFKRSTMAPIKGTAPEALKKVASKYGIEYAKEIEQAMRLETRHFKSGQWLKCGSAGMVADVKKFPSFPWGWTSLQDFCNAKGLSPSQFSTVHFGVTSEGPKSYIRFPETGLFVEFFAWFIKKKRGGNVSAWFRISDKDYDGDGIGDQTEYRNAYKHIETHFV